MRDLGAGWAPEVQCAGPLASGHALALTNQPPAALQAKPIWAKAKGVNLTQIRSGAPKTVLCQTLADLRQLLQPNWYQMYWATLSFGHYQQGREGDSDAWATQDLHTTCPGLRPGEDTPASPKGVDKTREAAVTGYKLSARLA